MERTRHSGIATLGRLCILAFLLCASRVVAAEFKLNALFSDNMVLQRNQAIPVWGTGTTGTTVTVTLNGQTAHAPVDARGVWQVRLAALPAGGPFVLTATDGATTLERKNVLIGEVWLCSGQSNMEHPVKNFTPAEEWLRDANYPAIRLLTVQYQDVLTPASECKTTGWAECNATTAATFSATGFLFGKELHTALQVPVGIINASISGSVIDKWMSVPALEGVPDAKTSLEQYGKAVSELPAKQAAYNEEVARRNALSPEERKALPALPFPYVARLFSGFYYGMISPLMPYGIQGVAWYQGESNAMFAQGEAYRRYLPALISDWRTNWGQGDFPFLIIQLPGYGKSNGTWPDLRESQAVAAQLPRTGLVVTIDLGEAENIHPNRKAEVGKRLALMARQLAYGEPLVSTGPTYKSMAVGEGGKVTLTFDHLGGGLVARGETPGMLAGFSIAGADKRFLPATAEIIGETVVVWNERIPAPAAVRYAWSDFPTCTLYNTEGLPAAPFRTDDWPLPTQRRK